MGWFNFKKKPDALKEMACKIENEVFPDGKEQIDTEVGYVKRYLKTEYPIEDILGIYVYAVIKWHTDDSMRNKTDMVNAIVRNYKYSFTAEDATLIYNCCLNKFTYGNEMRLENLFNKLKNTSNSVMVFMITKGAVVEITNRYKDLSAEGKFEVVVFNYFLIIELIKQNIKVEDKQQNLIIEILAHVVAEGKSIGLSMDTVMDILNYRDYKTLYHFQEITERSAIKVYYNFFIKPLNLDEINYEGNYLNDYYEFLLAFNLMRKWVLSSFKKVNNIINQ